MKNVHQSLLETIGNTPIIKINKVVPKDSPHQFFAKVEYFNPGGSVKDRVAAYMISEAERKGLLKPGGMIIEATSGNTGMGLAMIASIKGYKCIFVMPDKISEEKRAILRAYGAEVVITPTNVDVDDPRSYISVCKRLVAETPGSFHTNQYHNPDNMNQHYRSTGPEIFDQFGDKIDVFVAGAGTGGTISGVGRFFKEKKPSVQIIMADPVGSILYDLFYHKKVVTPPAPYKVEGVGEDMLPDNVQLQYIDGVVQVTDQQSFKMTQEIIRQEGLCIGPSSAMALVGAIEWSKKLTKPSNILVLFPDNGRGYLSKAFNPTWLSENGLN